MRIEPPTFDEQSGIIMPARLILEPTTCECVLWAPPSPSVPPGYELRYVPCTFDQRAIRTIATAVKLPHSQKLACPECGATRKEEHKYRQSGLRKCHRCNGAVADSPTPGVRVETLYDHLPLAPLLTVVNPIYSARPTDQSWAEQNLGYGNIYTLVDYGERYNRLRAGAAQADEVVNAIRVELDKTTVQYISLVRGSNDELCDEIRVFITRTGISVRPAWRAWPTPTLSNVSA